MADTISPSRRSEIMSRIRAKGTKPEMAVRRLVHSMGYRYRLHRADLPGTPDLVFQARKKVIFVHGCFWHQHADPGCKISHIPKSNLEFWEPKLAANAKRDQEHEWHLRRLGWNVLIVWECQLHADPGLSESIRGFLGPRRSSARSSRSASCQQTADFKTFGSGGTNATVVRRQFDPYA